MISHARLRRLSRRQTPTPLVISPTPLRNSALYFDTLEDLLDWCKLSRSPYDAFLIPRNTLKNRYRKRTGTLRAPLSVCHDFKGNYVEYEDLCPVGYFPHPSGNRYRMQFPDLVERFVYFLHHFIAVPTVAWLNTCHRMGVPCLGTILVEGNSQEKQAVLLKLCTQNAANEYVYVAPLVALMSHYRFDGFLLNVELRFLSDNEARHMLPFVELLKAAMHAVAPTLELVWYDAFVPLLNRTKYENGILPLNYPLFKAADLFLTNYWWDESTLKKNVAVAGLEGTKSALLVGIDMWGRGMKVGSGGFDAPLAVSFCEAYDSGACLFAPAWTYEFLGPTKFEKNDLRLWWGEDALSDHVVGHTACCLNPFSGNKAHNFVFYTNFCTGQGKAYYINGKSVFNNFWVEGGVQHEMPKSVYEKRKGLKFSVETEEAFLGGCSVRVVKNNIAIEEQEGTLFQFENDCRSEKVRVRVSFRYEEEDIENDGLFELVLGYRMERRYRATRKIGSGVLRLPLERKEGWQTIQHEFETPKGVKWEVCVLENVSVHWEGSMGLERLFSNIYQDDLTEEDGEWIVLPESGEAGLLIGEIGVWSVLDEDTLSMPTEANGVESLEEVTQTGKEILIQWADYANNLTRAAWWHVYVNDEFVGVAQAPIWRLVGAEKGKVRLRIDGVSCIGSLIPGKEILVNVK